MEIVKEEYIGLYELIKRTFGVELPDDQYETISDDVRYAVIQFGVPLQKVVEIARNYYDKHEWCQDDIPGCFGYGLQNEGFI